MERRSTCGILKVDKSVLKLCACMGPMHGDPYCYCEMENRGLKVSEKYKMTPEQEKKLDDALADIFEWKKNGKPRTRDGRRA